jgi:acyl-CoA thioester hydrolase
VTAFQSPFEIYETSVIEDWMDVNGHMNVACYGIVFDRANYAIGSALGLGADYVEAFQHGIFVVETHSLFFGELLLGDHTRVRTLIVGSDDKRLHLAHELIRTKSGQCVATYEVMYVHVNLALRRVTPFLPQGRASSQGGGESSRRIASTGLARPPDHISCFRYSVRG